MQRSNRELWLALIAMLLITLLYLFVMSFERSIPSASGFFGHALGILGFILMLLTETLYSWRKRSRSARWGRMAAWLRFHIFTGLVGPFMVLLHTSWKFNGLAGIVTLFTLIIVFSGIIGRYIYTAIPRTPDGIEIEAQQLSQQIQALENQLQRITSAGDQSTRELAQRLNALPQTSSAPFLTFLGNIFFEWSYRRQWRSEKRRLGSAARAQAEQLQKVFKKRNALRRQIETVAIARRMLALWHALHIPIGIALFISAFVHIGGALYYATLLR
ncbi:MAG: hypothetical protein HN413_11625 [Chloroflexi bacterium]|jgi:hypothetical protein|nr:hypothetical protein [Chloroflexota bacterium]